MSPNSKDGSAGQAPQHRDDKSSNDWEIPAEGANRSVSSSSSDSYRTKEAKKQNAPQIPNLAGNLQKVDPNQRLLALGIKCGCQRQMHRLAEVYYLERDKWLHFLPLTILTLISGALAFMASTTLFEGGQEILTLLVGFVSLVSVAIQSCAKNSKYAAKSEMHRIAALQMQKLTDNIEFHLIDPESGVARNNEDMERGAPDSSDDKFALSGSITEKIQSCRAIYNQIMDSCDSTIPTAIAQGFDLVDTRLTICLNNNIINGRVKAGLSEQETSKKVIMLAVYTELYSEYSNAFGWPWRTINPHHAVNRALTKVNYNYIISDQFLSENYDMDEGVGALFSWACCCCMDTSSWFWVYCRKKRLSQMKEAERNV